MTERDTEPDTSDDGYPLTRRAALGAAAGALGATGGCVQRMHNIADWRSGDRISLDIKTLPADADEAATSIARELAANLSAVGVDTKLVPMAESELYRDVLVNQEFDVYVAQFPGRRDPDFLRPLLHSTFNEDIGWQNPFGFSDLDVDGLLDRQRTATGARRRSVVSRIQYEVVRKQPFGVIAFPDRVVAARHDRYDGWDRFAPDDPLSYLLLRDASRADSAASTTGSVPSDRLRVAVTDRRVTRNLNPITAEYPDDGAFTDLLYDPLARWHRGRIVPWMARSWTWADDGGSDGPTAAVRLREGIRWHDGRPVTASDVAFTYRFLADTLLGKRETPVPSPRYHGRVSLVESVRALDERTVELSFRPCGRTVALRAFSVPVLPRRHWRPKASDPKLAGVEVSDAPSEALVWNNPSPVGSGPLRFRRSVTDELLLLSRFDDHFLHRDGGSEATRQLPGGVPFRELSARVVPSSAAAVELVAVDRTDATAVSVNLDVVPEIGRYDDVRLHTSPARSFYHIGFNARKAPTTNPRFRRTVARLLDNDHLVEQVFAGYATPAVSPLANSQWLASGLEWAADDHELPFLGSRGELDVERAREAFRRVGYRYDDSGGLLES